MDWYGSASKIFPGAWGRSQGEQAAATAAPSSQFQFPVSCRALAVVG